MKDFDDMLAKDREFTVGGETFHWRDVRPEVLTNFEPSENGRPVFWAPGKRAYAQDWGS